MTRESNQTETHQIAVLSTLHLSPTVLDYLADNADEHSARLKFGIWAGTYGVIVAAPTTLDQLDSTLLPALGQIYENQLWNVMHWALTNKHKYVMFDRDADVVPALPAYRDDWGA